MTDSDPTGVLLMAYGTPDTLDAVEPYYTHIRRGRKPAPELVEDLKQRYEVVGGQTSLLEITEATRQGLEDRLNARGEDTYRVILGMKHWHPFIEEGVRRLATENVRRAVGLVLAPHYSNMSIAGYFEYVEAAQQRLGTDIEIVPIRSWHLHPPYLKAIADRVQTRLQEFPEGEGVMVVFTAHSLPQRILSEGDPYQTQLMETSEALASTLAPNRWTFSYQSAGQTGEPWLGPDLVDTVERLADEGERNVLVVPIGFVSDHLEILFDIDHEAKEVAQKRGITLRRIDSLNASPDFVEALAELVLTNARALPSPTPSA